MRRLQYPVSLNKKWDYSWCKMKKNECQAYTKKKVPCENSAINGSDFCPFHKGFFQNFPPVKITALMCPYCGKALRRGYNYCKFCKNSILLCPYCDEPLIMDAKICSFCKEDLTPVIPESYKNNFFGMLVDIRNSIAERPKNISYGCFWVVVLVFMTLVFSFFTIDIFSYLYQ
jgi:hypothetical protein